jgi:hypothetical protein
MDQTIDDMIFEQAFMDGNTDVISRFKNGVSALGPLVTFSGETREKVEELLSYAADEDEDGDITGPGAIIRFINREWGFDDEEDYLTLLRIAGDSSLVMKNLGSIVGDIVRDYSVDYALCSIGDNMALDLGLCENWDDRDDNEWMFALTNVFNSRDKKMLGWYQYYFKFRAPIDDWDYVNIITYGDALKKAMLDKLRA